MKVAIAALAGCGASHRERVRSPGGRARTIATYAARPSMTFARLRSFLPIVLAVGTIVWRFAFAGASPPGDASVWELAWLFLAILACTDGASHHADVVAHRLGEPLGTIVLTLSVIIIEVALVSAMMLAGHGEATVARETMFATLMIIMNGLAGAALLAGGIERREQFFNLQSSGSFLALIIPLALIGRVLPRFTQSAPGGYMTPRMEWFVAIACVAVYGAFLWMQTSRYRSFFAHEDADGGEEPAPEHWPEGASPAAASEPLWKPVAKLVGMLVLVVVLSESLGGTTIGVLQRHGLPTGLAGVLVALLILGPEGVAAIKAARANSMQRTMNILLGSALSTIGLTVPAVLILSHIVGRRVELGLEGPEIALLAGTLMVSVVNFNRGRVNPMQGIVHLTFFFTYIALIFDLPAPPAP
jgi:Ca2+:H+ antiporter